MKKYLTANKAKAISEENKIPKLQEYLNDILFIIKDGAENGQFSTKVVRRKFYDDSIIIDELKKLGYSAYISKFDPLYIQIDW